MAAYYRLVLMARPSWLPELDNVEGPYDEVIARLYQVWVRDFQRALPTLRGMPVWWDGTLDAGQMYERGYLHLVTRYDKRTQSRVLDRHRAARLCWCGPVLSHADDPAVKVWEFRESHRKVRTYVWLEEFDYLMVLETRLFDIGVVAFLTTAYHLDGDAERKKYRDKYARRIN